MKNIDYEYLDEQYEGMPSRTATRKSTDPVGSLTDNRRMVKPNRDGAHNRVRDNKMKWYRKVNIPGSHDYQPKWSNLE